MPSAPVRGGNAKSSFQAPAPLRLRARISRAAGTIRAARHAGSGTVRLPVPPGTKLFGNCAANWLAEYVPGASDVPLIVMEPKVSFWSNCISPLSVKDDVGRFTL